MSTPYYRAVIDARDLREAYPAAMAIILRDERRKMMATINRVLRRNSPPGIRLGDEADRVRFYAQRDIACEILDEIGKELEA